MLSWRRWRWLWANNRPRAVREALTTALVAGITVAVLYQVHRHFGWWHPAPGSSQATPAT